MCAAMNFRRSFPVSLILLATLASAVAQCGGITGQADDPNLPDIASCPDPPDGAVGIVTPLLQWTAGNNAFLHRVYFGTSPEPGAAELVSLQQRPTLYYHMPGLAPATTYYWRIDTIEPNGAVHIGDVWRFSSAPATAWAPFPRDGEKWVETGVTLTWKPGLYAVSHEVCFGTDRGAVANRDPELRWGNQALCEFAPTGPLAPETTYYWAVDEIDATGTRHEGAVWRFTTVGPGGGVKAEYFDSPYPDGIPIVTRIENAIDHRWGDNGGTDGVSNARSARWTADLEIAVADTYTFISTNDGGVQLRLDGMRIIDHWGGQPTTDSFSEPLELEPGFYALQMESYEGRTVVQLSWQTPTVPRRVIQAGPLQPPVRAREPQPRRGTTDVPHNVTLRWFAGDAAAWHHVYLGDDKDALANATTTSADIYRGRQAVDETTYEPEVLEWNKTYFWRVDEAEADGTVHEGSVWSFTTADFVVVDDFESYTDEEGERIFDIWIDGWDIPTNGSIVGLVFWWDWWMLAHGGQQSMPFNYDNSGPAYYSEAYRAWDVPQDWTVGGVSDLSLWVMGRPASFLERPDGRVVVGGDAGARDGTDDDYGFAYKQLHGDGEIVARVDSLSNAEGWTRAGVMMRESLAYRSPYVAVSVTAAYGVSLAHRPTKNANPVQVNHPGPQVPHWVTLTRRGNIFTAQHSSDGVIWQDVNDAGGQPAAATLAVPKSVYIGLCVTGQSQTATAEFSNIATSGAVTGLWQAVSDSLNSPDDFYVALEDSSGRIGVSVHPDPMAVNVENWTQWKVPLDQFSREGVDITSMSRMYIGVGDRNAPQPDGTGRIWIDDIRLTKQLP